MSTVAFGDAEAGIWGVSRGDQLGVATAASGIAEHATVTLARAETAGEWTLEGAQARLSVSPVGTPLQDPQTGRVAQLCRVQGHVDAAGGRRELDCLGLREEHEPHGEAGDECRIVMAWFSAEHGVFLESRRPRRAAGHDRDAVVAALWEGTVVLPSVQPRLSTTLDAGGTPLRMGLELWIETEDGEAEYPTRASGEVAGPVIPLSGPAGTRENVPPGLAYPLLTRARGHAGAGMFLLLRHNPG